MRNSGVWIGRTLITPLLSLLAIGAYFTHRHYSRALAADKALPLLA